MAKLYFRFGCVSSGKSLELISTAASYRAQGKQVIILKPSIDTRFSQDTIRSRTGLEAKVDQLISCDSDLDQLFKQSASIFLVDEAQFLTTDSIEKLRVLSIERDTPVICYGLRTDFKGRLFAGSQRLMEIADRIDEVKSICSHCHSKASFNLRLRNGRPDFTGPVIQLGSNESYEAVCAQYFYAALNRSSLSARESSLTSGPSASDPQYELQALNNC